MDKNRIIKKNLEFHLSNSIKLFKGAFSFLKVVQQELNNFDNIKWLPSEGFDNEKLKDDSKNELVQLLNDTQLHLEIDQLIDDLVDVNEKRIQDDIESQLLENLSSISLSIPDEKKDLELNLLFIEHNYHLDTYFSGFDDASYAHKLLSGKECLKYDYKKELFIGAGGFKYNALLSPYLKFEERLGEEKVDTINEALFGGNYLEEVKKLYLLNGFLGIHLCLDRIGEEIRRIDIPMRNEVFIFGNEHDCEQLNIYVL